MQALQNKAARTIAKVKFNDAGHPRLLRDLGWLDVRNLLELDMEIFMYKCQNKLVPDSITNPLAQCILIKNELQNQELYIKGAKIWNEIPYEIPEQSIASKRT